MIDINSITKSQDSRRIDLEGRILVAHQAEFMPWLGFISKATMGDVYLILDDSQFKKEYFENRNKIRIKNEPGWQWIRTEVENKKIIRNLNEINLINNNWKKKILNSITLSYSKAPYFKYYIEEIKYLFENINTSNLAEFNVGIIKWAFRKFKIEVPFYRTSQINKNSQVITGKASDLVISMCKAFDADVFVAGVSGKDYLDKHKFREEKITLVFQKFKPSKYHQMHGEFIPYMSFVDILFNHGEEKAIEILGKSDYEF